MNLTGVLLVFLAFPLLVAQLFRQVFETKPPTESRLSDHIIIADFSPQDEVLGAELRAAGIDHLYIETDSGLVTQLNEQGIVAILGDPEDIATLRSVNAEHARALVADLTDDVNPTVILSGKQINSELRTVSVVRNYQVEEYQICGCR